MSEMEWRARAKRREAANAGVPLPAAAAAQPLKRNQSMHFGAIQTATHYDAHSPANMMGEDGKKKSLAEQLGLRPRKAKVLKAPETPAVDTPPVEVKDEFTPKSGDEFNPDAAQAAEDAETEQALQDQTFINSDVVEPVKLVTPPATTDKDDLL
jgi:hypothetical protein